MALIRDIKIGMSISNDAFNAKLKQAEARLGSFANSTISVRSALTALGSAFAIRAAAGGIKDAVLNASNLNATLSKTGIVFGGSAAIITKQADEMASAYGTAKTEFIDAATSFGAIFKGAGQGQERAAKLGVTLTKLGMDMASFEGGAASNADAFAAISSALRGEFDPIERFRVFLSAAKIENEALTTGLAKSKAEMTDYAKKMATLSLITKQTADAQGDLARTATDADNRIKSISGRFKNMGAEIGMALKPATDAIFAMADTGMTRLSAVIDQNKAAITGWVQSGVAKVGELGFVFRNLPDFLEIAGIKVGEVVENMSRQFSTFGENVATIGKYIGENWVKFFSDAFSATSSLVTNLFTNLKDLVSGFLASVFSGDEFEFAFTPLLDGFQATMAELPKLATPSLVSFEDQVNAKIDEIGRREADMAAKIGQKVPVAGPKAPGGLPAMAKVADKDKAGKEAPRFAAALDARSAEAYSQQLKFLSQGPARKDEPIKEVVKTGKEQVDVSRQMLAGINKLVERAGGAIGAALFQI